MTLNLEVMGGLVSRLRAVLAADIWCRRHGHDLVVNWPRIQPNLPEWDGFRARLSYLWQHPWIEQDMGVQYWPKEITHQKGGYKVRTCHPETFDVRADELREAFLRLVPRPRLQRAIDAVCMRPSLRMIVGVQVRSYIPQPGNPPVEWYVEKLAERDGLFYLVADERSTGEILRAAYPGRVLERKKDYQYGRRGILHSAADLYVLSQCDWVIGSAGSSYAELVAVLRGAKITGPLGEPGSIQGGRYEDKWNPAN